MNSPEIASHLRRTPSGRTSPPTGYGLRAEGAREHGRAAVTTSVRVRVEPGFVARDGPHEFDKRAALEHVSLLDAQERVVLRVGHGVEV